MLGILLGLLAGVLGTLAFQRLQEQRQQDEDEDVLAEMIRQRLSELERRADA